MPNPVRAIPEGYHTITPGRLAKTQPRRSTFYKSVFGAKEIMRMPGPGGMIMHAEIQNPIAG
jgi:PhnB protein